MQLPEKNQQGLQSEVCHADYTLRPFLPVEKQFKSQSSCFMAGAKGFAWKGGIDCQGNETWESDAVGLISDPYG